MKPSSPSTTVEATQHAWRIWRWLIGITLGALILYGLAWEIAAPTAWWPVALVFPALLGGILLAVSASVWWVFGPGSLRRRLLPHGLVMSTFGLLLPALWLFPDVVVGDSPSIEMICDYGLAAIGLVYGHLAVTLTYTLAAWGFRLRRYRLSVIGDQEEAEGSSRSAEALIPKSSIADLMTLTAIAALLLTSWGPITWMGEQTTSSLGSLFAFWVAGFLACATGLVGIPAVLLPTLCAMVEPTQPVKQVIVQSLSAFGSFAVFAGLSWSNQWDVAATLYFATSWLVGVAFQLLIMRLTGERSRRFRFRLVRTRAVGDSKIGSR